MKHLKSINNTAPSKNYIRLISRLNHRQALSLFQLCTGHIGLNHHLFCIFKSETLVETAHSQSKAEWGGMVTHNMVEN